MKAVNHLLSRNRVRDHLPAEATCQEAGWCFPYSSLLPFPPRHPQPMSTRRTGGFVRGLSVAMPVPWGKPFNCSPLLYLLKVKTPGHGVAGALHRSQPPPHSTTLSSCPGTVQTWSSWNRPLTAALLPIWRPQCPGSSRGIWGLIPCHSPSF